MTTDPARSAQMARIRSKDTKPELRVRRLFHRLGLRYKLHSKCLPGHPDLVFPGAKVVVFVHGCFWHRHAGCGLARLPKTRLSFWVSKLDNNVARDSKQKDLLETMGWRVFVVWECETRDEARLRAIAGEIRGSYPPAGAKRSRV